MRAESVHSERFLLTSGDRGVSALAERQGGAVSTEQLRALGLGDGAIALRARNGRLHAVHRGVWAVGRPSLAQGGRLWAALLACGGPDLAIVSHQSAADAWDLAQWTGEGVHITTLRSCHATTAIRVHRSRTLDARSDVFRMDDGLPITTVGRTLFDLATNWSPHRVERACHRAEILRLLDARETDALVARVARAPGAKRLRTALATLTVADPEDTHTPLEDDFLALIVRFNLKRPLVNHPLHGYVVDFYWPDHGLVVETDGRGAHDRPTAFEADRWRDATLLAHGIRTLRFTRRHIRRRAAEVAARVTAALDA
jgi:very-short-patch-repair endonuclease/predicted transcriptional regulator of viral defense system